MLRLQDDFRRYNQGRLNFMAFKKRFNAQVFLEFPRGLLRRSDHRVYLIIDRHPVHRSRGLQSWIKEKEAGLRLVFLPGYNPELTPDELLNQDVKSKAPGRQRPRQPSRVDGQSQELSSEPSRETGYCHRIFPGGACPVCSMKVNQFNALGDNFFFRLTESHGMRLKV
jgi:hypothetical protein